MKFYKYLLIMVFAMIGNQLVAQWDPHGVHSTTNNVSIGTSQSDAMLTVNGKIHSTDLIIDPNVDAPDYVFEADYLMMSLDELRDFISENKHLPGVPSASEMETNGINLEEMNYMLLEKIEELTLHILGQQERIEKLKNQNEELNLKIREIKQRNN